MIEERNGSSGVPEEANDPGPGAPDASLGGYVDTHDRPPAFEGPDGNPYTVSVEVEKTPDLAAPYVGYLVFPKWAATGVGIVGHVQSPVLVKARSADVARVELLETPLTQVKELLDGAVEQASDDAGIEPGTDPASDIARPTAVSGDLP